MSKNDEPSSDMDFTATDFLDEPTQSISRKEFEAAQRKNLDQIDQCRIPHNMRPRQNPSNNTSKGCEILATLGTVTDNHGHTYDVHLLGKYPGTRPSQGDPYKGASISVDNTPGSWYVKTLAVQPSDGISIDYGQGWEIPSGMLQIINKAVTWFDDAEPDMRENPKKNRPCYSECIRPKGHSGDCRRFPDRFYDSEGNMLEGVSQDELLAARKQHMRENPSRFKEGDRVTFTPTPAALQLYTAGTYPPPGTSGSVTTVQVPGGGRRTTMPGPRGGMLYVKWDGWNTVGVFPVDVVREGKRKNPGNELNAHEVLIDDPTVTERLFLWHSGQGDPVYAVASSSNAGRPVTRGLVDDAIANLQNFLRKTKGKDKKDLETLIDDLTPFGT